MKTILAVYLTSCFALTICAQEAAKTPSALHVNVGDVTDNRTTGSFNPECKVELKFTGDAAADAKTVRNVHVIKAEDELGRNLVPEQSESHSWSGSGFNHNHQSLTAEMVLRNPSRNASVIKVVEGEVELFNPTEANGGILVIKDVLKHPAEPAANPMLKKCGVELMYLTKESYEAKKKQIEDEQKKGNAVEEALTDAFTGMLGGMMTSDSKNAIRLYIKDPKKRVVDFELQDSNGKALKSHSSWSMNEMHNIDLAAPAPPDAQLLIHLATPEASHTVRFKLENIALP